jgi:small-conductance mechanosensitive channel
LVKLFWILVVLASSLWLSQWIEKRVLHRTIKDIAFRKIGTNVVRGVLLLIGLLWVLSVLGLDLTTLSIFSGALGVGVGLGLKQLATNYISGFTLLFERSLRIGDLVRIGTFEGIITDIKSRHTVVRSQEGVEAIVPNEKLLTERVDNFVLSNRRVLLKSHLNLALDTEVDKAFALLRDAVALVPRVLEEPPPSVWLSGFGNYALEFTVGVWINDPQNGQNQLRSDVNVAILKAVREAGLKIPYPQSVVYSADLGAEVGEEKPSATV